MIISISGYAGSGKDTVGSIIQYLNSECSNIDGKHYRHFDDFLKHHTGNNDFQNWYNSDWEVKRWAGKLKIAASLLTGISTNEFEDQDFKKSFLPEEWDFWTVSVIDNKKLAFQQGRFTTKEEADQYAKYMEVQYGTFRLEYVVGMQRMTVRQLLQELGTDACRNNLHPNVWVNALMSDYKPAKLTQYNPSKWIITDTRFPNEAEAVKSKNGVMVRVVRPGFRPVNSHTSETSLDDYPFDFIIENNGDRTHLIEQVKKMLEVINKSA